MGFSPFLIRFYTVQTLQYLGVIPKVCHTKMIIFRTHMHILSHKIISEPKCSLPPFIHSSGIIYEWRLKYHCTIFWYSVLTREHYMKILVFYGLNKILLRSLFIKKCSQNDETFLQHWSEGMFIVKICDRI